VLFSGLATHGGGLQFPLLGNRSTLSQNAPLTQLFNPHKAKAVPVAAQFNGIVSEGPKPAWEKAIACAGPPDTTFFITDCMHISLRDMLHVFFHGVCHPDDGRSRRRGGAPHARLRRSTASYQTSLAYVQRQEQQTRRWPLGTQPLSVGMPFQTLPMRIVLPSKTSWSLVSSQQSCGRPPKRVVDRKTMSLF